MVELGTAQFGKEKGGEADQLMAFHASLSTANGGARPCAMPIRLSRSHCPSEPTGGLLAAMPVHSTIQSGHPVLRCREPQASCSNQEGSPASSLFLRPLWSPETPQLTAAARPGRSPGFCAQVSTSARGTASRLQTCCQSLEEKQALGKAPTPGPSSSSSPSQDQ